MACDGGNVALVSISVGGWYSYKEMTLGTRQVIAGRDGM
jgi:hypothetical protein